jgi:hypothetical protein
MMPSTAYRASHARRLILPVIAGLLALVAMALPLAVSAHETRAVATDYEFVVGFVTEPAIAGEVNGIWVSVSKGDEPVEGLAGTLQAEVIYGDQTREATLTPSFDEPGVYISTFIPTAEGDYTFRFHGQVEGVDIDESFTSSPEGFHSVAPRSEYEFPGEEGSSSRELVMPVIVGGALMVIGGLAIAMRRRHEG